MIAPLAPTIADLRELRFGFRDSLLAEASEWTVLRDPHDGEPRVYRASDWLQQHDLSREQPELAKQLLDKTAREQRFHDYLLRQGRIWPRTSS